MNLEMKQEAIARMKKLRVRKEIVDSFSKTGQAQICTRPYGAFILPTEAETAYVKQFEEEHAALVYLILRAVTLYGTLDSYIFVSSKTEQWECECDSLKKGVAYTYTVNENYPGCSEFGTIEFSHTVSRGIIRTDIDFF